jgi:hypothetical protein
MQLRFLVFLLTVIGMMLSTNGLIDILVVRSLFVADQSALVDIHRSALDTQPVDNNGSMQCKEPTSPEEDSCDMKVRRMLATVVRYEFFVPEKAGSDRLISALGHGTVKDGRYLVVHNHFGVDLARFESGIQDALLSMHNGIGDLFLWDENARLSIVLEETEALVLDFGLDSDGRGFFESKSIQSAAFDTWQNTELEIGQSVAQVFWDGQRSGIAWTSIEEVIVNDGTPRIVLANPLLHGASGGGVFMNGAHIGVNWESGKHLDETGAVIEEFSTAALNSTALVDIG